MDSHKDFATIAVLAVLTVLTVLTVVVLVVLVVTSAIVDGPWQSSRVCGELVGGVR